MAKSTTRSYTGDVLMPEVFGPHVSSGSLPQKGFFNFENPETHEPYAFDIWNLIDEDRVSSPVIIMRGERLTGKTTTNIVLANSLGRRRIKGRRVRVGLDDHRPRNGIPEYRRYCQFKGQEEVQLSEYRINPLDMMLEMSYADQLDWLEDALLFVGKQELNADQGTALAYGLKKVRNNFPMKAELGLLALCLRTMTVQEAASYQAEIIAELATRHADDPEFVNLQNRILMRSPRLSVTDEVMKARFVVAQLIEKMLDGRYGNIFGGGHSLAEVLQRPIVAMDYSGINESAMVLLQSLLWRIDTSAVLRGDHRFHVDLRLFDENPKMFRYLSFARPMINHLKSIRSSYQCVVINSHRRSDYEGVGDVGSEQYNLAMSLDDEASIFMLGAHTPDGANAAKVQHELTRDERDMLVRIDNPKMKGHWLMKIGNQRPILVKTVMTPMLRSMTMSVAANKERVIHGDSTDYTY